MKFRHYFLYDENTRRPAVQRWQHTTATYAEKDLPETLRHPDKRLPLGIALQDDELVVDIDPRNGGVEGLKRLCHDAQLNIAMDCGAPIVRTGRGGWHYYFTKPANFKVVKAKYDEYPGIEFLSRGSNVIAPRSLFSPCAYDEETQANYGEGLGAYEYDFLSPGSIENAPSAPPALLELIERKNKLVAVETKVNQLTQSQITWGLSKLNPTDYRDYEAWRNLAFSIKHASAGHSEVKHLFIDWCRRDKKYVSDTEKISSIWDSADISRAGGITSRTFMQAIEKSGANPNDMLMLGDDIFGEHKKEPEKEIIPEELDARASIPNPSMWANIYYVAEWHAFYNIHTRKRMRKEAFNLLFSRHTPKPIESFFDGPDTRRQCVDGAYYQPYYPPTFDYLGTPCVNLWTGNVPQRAEISGKEVQPWLDHIYYLFSNEQEYIQHFHTYMAAVFQKKRRRVNYALVIYSSQEGIGKTTPIKRLLNRRFGKKNVGVLSNDVLTSKFNSSITDTEVVIFEDAQATQKYEIINKMKPWISDEEIERHAKGVDASPVPNFANYFIFTNNEDALAISANDRRFLVLSSHVMPPRVDYFPRFLRWLDKNADKVVDYYNNVDLDFDAICQRAPRTRAALAMQNASLPTYAQAIREILGENAIPHGQEFILVSAFYSKYLAKSRLESDHTNARYLKAFPRLGYNQLTRVRIQGEGKGDNRLRVRCAIDFNAIADFKEKVARQLDYLEAADFLN